MKQPQLVLQVLSSGVLACATNRPAVEPVRPGCQGTVTITNHSSHTLEVLIVNGGMSEGTVIETISAGQQSRVIDLPTTGFVRLRDPNTGQPPRPEFVNTQYRCQGS